MSDYLSNPKVSKVVNEVQEIMYSLINYHDNDSIFTNSQYDPSIQMAMVDIQNLLIPFSSYLTEQYYSDVITWLQSIDVEGNKKYRTKIVSDLIYMFSNYYKLKTNKGFTITTKVKPVEVKEEKMNTTVQSFVRTPSSVCEDTIQMVFLFTNSNTVKNVRVVSSTARKVVTDLINNPKVQALTNITEDDVIVKDKKAIVLLDTTLSSNHDVVSIILELIGVTQITSVPRG